MLVAETCKRRESKALEIFHCFEIVILNSKMKTGNQIPLSILSKNQSNDVIVPIGLQLFLQVFSSVHSCDVKEA